jgi:hypothetical protein
MWKKKKIQIPVDEAKEYRIVKNTRPIGAPFLLQRGKWMETTSNLTGRTRRAFAFIWEREFRTKREAEAARDEIIQREPESRKA